MKYIEYDVTDFALDENFKQWVLSPDAKNTAFWKAWLSENPEKLSLVSQARQMILMIHFKKDHPENDDFQTVWNAIQQAVSDPQTNALPSGKIVHMRVQPKASSQQKIMYRVAASISAIVLFGCVFWYTYTNFFQDITITTAYGELRSVVLPDASIVNLNANSSITYKRNWDKDQREVWLKGEAFFSVTHQQAHTPFTVHTNHLDVQVLGTEFNVDERADKTQVMLSSGKVKVDFQNASVVEKIVEMEPGELLAYTYHDNKVSKEKADTEKETAWRNNQLIYEDASIADVIQDVERQFGLEISVEQDAILEHKFSGVIPANNAEAFFITIKNTFDVQVIRNEKHITIKSNHQP
ncbi:FecR family protein [Catalinimonas niigatensis]|uniref:FecR family protein n=1 Tax=Catalinimonas niigatensis TaxID=1397264 RepID=UPI002666A54B|nr:FecR domain-containing protein [Catalinimonas niigatensis]WPP50962.1 FecR domain-containing protein [Catalinimonas niigatensis]